MSSLRISGATVAQMYLKWRHSFATTTIRDTNRMNMTI